MANTLLFSKNDYDFRKQRPEIHIPNPYGHYDVMNPLEVANILISSQNHYDFRNQRQKIPKKDVDQSPQQKSLHTPPLLI